jgi:hypothetical protein
VTNTPRLPAQTPAIFASLSSQQSQRRQSSSASRTQAPERQSTFVIYSLSRHLVVQKVVIPSGVGVRWDWGRDRVVVVCLFHSHSDLQPTNFWLQSTINPPTIHILSPTTLEIVYSLPTNTIVPAKVATASLAYTAVITSSASTSSSTTNLSNIARNPPHQQQHQFYDTNLHQHDNYILPPEEGLLFKGLDPSSARARARTASSSIPSGSPSPMGRLRTTSSSASSSNTTTTGELPTRTQVVTPTLWTPVWTLNGRLLAYTSPPPSALPPITSASAAASNQASVYIPVTATGSIAQLPNSPTSPTSLVNNPISSTISSSGSAAISSLSNALAGLGVNVPNVNVNVGSVANVASGISGGISNVKREDLREGAARGVSAAMKVGGSVLSGVRMIGGMALAAASGNGNTNPGGSLSPPAGGGNDAQGGGPGGGAFGTIRSRFFSRSAPSESSFGDIGKKGTSSGEQTGMVGDEWGSEVYKNEEGRGYFVTVIDLASLSSSSFSSPYPAAPSPPPPRVKLVSEFLVSSQQPVTSLKFSDDGTMLSVGTRDGQVVGVYAVRPVPNLGTAPSAAPSAQQPPSPQTKSKSRRPHSSSTSPTSRPNEPQLSAPWHVYTLRRGVTSGTIESMEWNVDARWVAVATRKRTVHLFAVNPFGGKVSEGRVRGHLEGRVREVDELVCIFCLLCLRYLVWGSLLIFSLPPPAIPLNRDIPSRSSPSLFFSPSTTQSTSRRNVPFPKRRLQHSPLKPPSSTNNLLSIPPALLHRVLARFEPLDLRISLSTQQLRLPTPDELSRPPHL